VYHEIHGLFLQCIIYGLLTVGKLVNGVFTAPNNLVGCYVVDGVRCALGGFVCALQNNHVAQFVAACVLIELAADIYLVNGRERSIHVRGIILVDKVFKLYGGGEQ
jgi:hypothetical protein